MVAPKSATFCNHKTYVPRAMADDMIDLLASLHSRFYGDPTLAERYRWLASYPRWFTIGAEKMGTENYTYKAFDAAAHVIPAGVLARLDKAGPATIPALPRHQTAPQRLIHALV